MNKLKIIFWLNIWVIILPFLGFPDTFKDILFSTTGLIYIYYSYMLYKDLKIIETKEKSFDNFSENSNFKEN